MVKLLDGWPKNDERLVLKDLKLYYESYKPLIDSEFKNQNEYSNLPSFPTLYGCQSEGLNSSLVTVATKFGGIYRFNPGVEALAAYLYFVNKDHNLRDGNKRISLIAGFGYLKKNGFWLKTTWEDIYSLSKEIAINQENISDIKKSKIWGTIIKNIQYKIIRWEDGMLEGFLSSIGFWVHTDTVKSD